MQFTSSNKISYLIVVILVLNLSFLVSQANGQAKKPRKTTRALVQPTAEKEESPTTKTSNSEPTRASNKIKKIMITDFDDRGIAKWWGGDWDIGSLFANTIIGPLSRTEGYDVVERSRMIELFKEQEISGSERFSQSAVTKIGRLLGADYILFGYLTNFSRKKSGYVVVKETSAQIDFSVRLVDVATGKVVKSAEINYVSPKKREYLKSDTELNPNDPEFLQSLFGKAISESTKEAVVQLTGENVGQTSAASNSSSTNLTSNQKVSDVVLQAKVADITGDTITINRGRSQGVKEGQFFAVLKVVKEIKDPDTGKVISQKTEELIRLKITKVDDGVAEGILVLGDTRMLDIGTQVVRVDPKKQ